MGNLKKVPCKKCSLGTIGKGVVKSWGKPSAPILILLDNPSSVDETGGRLMFGPEGQLLEILFADAFRILKIEPLDIFVTSIVRCRPVDIKRGPTREPNSNEILACTNRVLTVMHKTRHKYIFLIGKVVQKFYKKEYPDAAVLQPIRFLLKQGGKASPWYNSNLRIILETLT